MTKKNPVGRGQCTILHLQDLQRKKYLFTTYYKIIFTKQKDISSFPVGLRL